MVKQVQRGVLRGASVGTEVTSRTRLGAERGLASVSTQDLFPHRLKSENRFCISADVKPILA